MNRLPTQHSFQESGAKVHFLPSHDVDIAGFQARMQTMKERLEQLCNVTVDLSYGESPEDGRFYCLPIQTFLNAQNELGR